MDEEKQFKIIGKAYEDNVPNEKKYLLKYFKTDTNYSLLCYYFTFGKIDKDAFSFMGIYYDPFYSKKEMIKIKDAFKLKLKALLWIHKKYTDDFDLENLADLEMGKMPYNKIYKIFSEENKKM